MQATQYAGSAAMHKEALMDDENEEVDRRKKGGTVSGAAGNVLSAVKRYYSNNVTDHDKQHAINVFLCNYIPDPSGRKPHIWYHALRAWN